MAERFTEMFVQGDGFGEEVVRILGPPRRLWLTSELFHWVGGVSLLVQYQGFNLWISATAIGISCPKSPERKTRLDRNLHQIEKSISIRL